MISDWKRLTDTRIKKILDDINSIREYPLGAPPLSQLPPGIPNYTSKCVIAVAVATDEYPFVHICEDISWWRVDNQAITTEWDAERKIWLFDANDADPDLNCELTHTLESFIQAFDGGVCDRVIGLANGIPLRPAVA